MNHASVVVLFGGRSSEHSISCLSAHSVITALRAASHRVIPVGITRDGAWYLDPKTSGGALPEVLANDHPVDLRMSPPALVVNGAAQPFDVVFPVLHGPWGEDGTIQGLFESMHVPVVGSGVLASAVVMDKPTMKALLRDAGLPVVDWRIDDRGDLDFPLFVKPARAGSSVGISRVTNDDEYGVAVRAALQHDPRLIIEVAVPNPREIECAVLDGHASRCGEVRVKDGFYDFEAKYASDRATLIVPADLAPDVEAQIQSLAVDAYRALGCEGLARVDFFVLDDGRILVNEVNTMPGFTEISLFPRMWQATGVDYPTLIDRLVTDAVRRGPGLRNPNPAPRQR